MHPEAREELRVRFKVTVLEYAKIIGVNKTCREFDVARSTFYEWKKHYGERQEDGQLPLPVKFVLEEFPALGDLSSVVEFANLVRKRRLSFILACQTMGQLENIYGRNGAETLLAGMAFQVIFGGCDQATAKYYSDMAGIGTKRKSENDGKIQERHVNCSHLMRLLDLRKVTAPYLVGM